MSSVRDIMNDYFKTESIDLLDAHSFLWSIKLMDPYESN